ncbi:MAG: hypothetical protein ACRC1H_13070 [Caldilineaceae bacterium]
MTLKTDSGQLFSVGAPPQTADAHGLLRWCSRLFNFLQDFLRRPEFAGITLTRIDSAAWDESPAFKPEDGMLVYVGPGVLGPQGGLYIRDGNAWKKIT